MLRIYLFILLLFLGNLPYATAQTQQLRGTVVDSSGAPIAGATIYEQNSTYGVVSNAKGAFNMSLAKGSHTLVVQFLGYEKQIINVSIPRQNSLRVELIPALNELDEVAISAKGKDPAYGYMKKAIEKRSFHLDQLQSLKAKVYVKASLTKEELKEEIDSLSKEKKEFKTKERMNFVEKYAQIYKAKPNKIKEEVIAYKNYSDKPELLNISNSLADYGFYMGEDEIYDVNDQPETNPLLYGLYPLEQDFNIYQSLISLPKLHEMPFISPLHPLSLASYKYELLSTFIENEKSIHEIKIIPRRPSDALFSGTLYLIDGEWAVKSVNFKISKQNLSIYQSFQFTQQYAKVDSAWLCTRQEYFYDAQEEEITFIGHTIHDYTEIEPNATIDKKIFDGAVSVMRDSAEQKATILLAKHRPLSLKSEETGFIAAQDSIAIAHSKPAYLNELDSSYNHTDFWDVLLYGIEQQNSLKGRYIYILPILDQLRFFQPGGYRHAFGGTYSKFYKETGREFETYQQIDYGPLNQDLRGRLRAAYTSNNFNFATWHASVGSEYELINQNPSFVANITPGNYNLINHISLGYDREYSNGFYVNTNLRYAKHKPVNDLELPQFNDSLVVAIAHYFEENMSTAINPVDFAPFTKLVFDADIAIRFKQQYRKTGVRKVILGSKYPKLNINLRIGLPNILGSISNFGYLEARVHDKSKLGSYGYSQYNVAAGTFLWDNAIQLVDKRFFIGGDIVWFTNPMRGQQLLGQFLNTTEPFIEYHYRHNFNGAIMNKIPLLRALRLGLTAGTNGLFLSESNFSHIETYYGIEKKFRIATELLKVGFFLLNGVNSDLPFTTDYRLSLSFYNPVSKRWM